MHTYRWEDNIKINLKGIRYDGVDWIHLAQDRGRSEGKVVLVR